MSAEVWETKQGAAENLSPQEEFRLLGEADFDAWFEVLKKGYEGLKGLPISFEAIGATKEEAHVWFEEIPIYGLFIDGRLGAAVGLRMPWGPKPGYGGFPHLGWLVTHPDFQGHGLAKKTYERLEEEVLIRQLRTPAVTLGTAQEHPWLVNMYLSFGFEIERTVQLPGKVHHTVYMKKKLLSF